VRMTTLQSLFGPEGPLARQLDQYEPRSGQVEMATAVARALEQEHVLFCEAGTGTGKTLAYLLPAVLSGKKVIVSTATRTLQEQIYHHDLPLVQRVLGRPVAASLLKGLGNYLCIRRHNELLQGQTPASVPAARLRLVNNWRAETDQGDLGELVGLSEQDIIRNLVNSSSETRLGPRCPHFEECFVTRAKRNAAAAQIVVVNHHLFFADLALRGPHPGRVLPDYDAVVFDEAHQIEEVATLFFGTRVSRHRVQTLIADAARVLPGAADPLLGKRPRSVDQARSAEAGFFDALLSAHGRAESRVRLRAETWSGTVGNRYFQLDSSLEGIEHSAELARVDAGEGASQLERLDGIIRRVRGVRDALASIVEATPGRVTWLEGDKSPTLSACSVDLSEILNDRVFNQIPSVVLTSATLASADPNRPFAFVRARLGAENCETAVEECVVPSPFDFASHSLLYLPKGLPEPNEPSFLAAAVEQIKALVTAADGGAFVLTTSVRSMRLLHQRLSSELPGRHVLVQGSAPKHALLANFRRSERAVLVATMGFWEGVDIPGRALRLVILEKIPFPVPTDPLVEARCQALEEDGKNPFVELFLPAAAIALKQGFGRLIRNQSDRGVVALLDCRIHTRGYGAKLLAGLPPAGRASQLADASAFLAATK
jgi:ATP-dependent DNA helicase DinG